METLLVFVASALFFIWSRLKFLLFTILAKIIFETQHRHKPEFKFVFEAFLIFRGFIGLMHFCFSDFIFCLL